MNELLSQLFGAGDLRLGVDGVRLGLAHPLAPWIWALIVIGAGGVSAWSYWRLEGRRSARIALAALRATLLLLIALMLAGPRLVKPNETVEKDWVVVLADRSGSMRVADVDAGGNAGGTRITRDRQMRDALRDAYPALSKVAAERELLFLGFDGAAYPIKVERDAQGLMPLNLPEASGTRTSIATALSQAMARTAARPVSGFVLLSDGRTSEPPDKALLRRLQADGIPIFALPLGSPSPVGDLAITRVESPSAAFVRDTVPVQVRIERRGTTSPDSTAVVELVDDTTGRVLESRPLAEGAIDPLDESVVSLTLSGSETDAGARSWTVRLKTAAADLITENNERSIQLDMIDRPIRTVYFDGYPRWEFRYLKNLLIREGSIRSSNLLLAVEKRFLQEGDELLRSLPRSSEEWAPFDVVVMGDLRPELFTSDQLQQLKEHIAIRGAGLLWVAGPGATPGAWFQTPLAELLPFTTAPGQTVGAQTRVWDRPVVVKPTEASERLGLLNLSQPRGWPAQLASADTGWSQLRWAQRIDPATVKPSAEVLALALPIASDSSGSGGPVDVASATPLVLTMRYGAGRVMYVATDETWRWRYARGETLQERFWLPLVRLLARESVARSGQPAVLDLSQRVVSVEQPVRIAVRLLDQSLVDASPQSLRVRVTPVGEGSIGRAPTMFGQARRRKNERFTDRARKVMALARQEAQRFNHEYIGTEHILLGLVKEGSGVGANVLKNLDVDLRKVRLEVEKLVKSGPEMVTMGQLPFRRRAPRRSSSTPSKRPATSTTTTSAPSTCCSACCASTTASPPRSS
jgi:hypothetical protein